MSNNKILIIGGTILAMGISIGIYQCLFSAPQKKFEMERIVISLGTTEKELIPKLKEQGYIRSEWAFKFVLKKWWEGKIRPGSYKVSKNMNAWILAETFVNYPYQKWVIIPEGLRKEEIAEIAKYELGWSESTKEEFLTNAKEGYLFPDTYLFQVLNFENAGKIVAERMENRFNEKFQPVSEGPIEVVEKFIEADMAGARLGGQLAKEAPDIKKYYTLFSGFPTNFAYEGDIAMVIKKYEIIDEHPSENENSYFVKVRYFCKEGIASGFTEGARNVETGEKISIQKMDKNPGLVSFDCDYFYNSMVDPSIVKYNSETQTETITFELIKDRGLWRLNSPSICPRISEKTLKKHLEIL